MSLRWQIMQNYILALRAESAVKKTEFERLEEVMII